MTIYLSLSSASSRTISESPTSSSQRDKVCCRVYNSELGVPESAIAKWEEENGPYLLPDDYKAFLQISDGLSLNWKIKKND